MDGLTVGVRVQPRAKRNAVELLDDGTLKVYVTAPPESGKANEALIALLSKRLRVPKGSIQVVGGHRSRDKTLMITSFSVERLRGQLVHE